MPSPLDRLYHAIRHPAASQAGAARDTVAGFDRLHGHGYCLLVTYRRSGETVPTPVWFALHDGCAYIRTARAAAKVGRIRNDPRVRLAPCTLRGRPLGAPADGRARVIEPPDPEAGVAERALKARYGLRRRIYERVSGSRPESLVYLAVTPA